ncbi:MAG: hypothetical protein LBI04_00650 [Treponema sp.]|jgi:hypothetical protein|nr:hypothetical protein [Treponema sp.]
MKKILLAIPVILLAFSSCLGLSADFQMRKNGSGKLTTEYRFPRTAENIGRLDGNERWQIIPVGRADWERTAARIDGIKLSSFSSRNDSKDVVNKVTIEFSNTDALLKFLNPSPGGKRASLNRGSGSSSLNIIFTEPAASEINADLLALMQQVSYGYKLKLTFSAEKNSSLSFTDGSGKLIPPPENAEVVLQGKKVSFSIDTAELISFTDGLGIEISW